MSRVAWKDIPGWFDWATLYQHVAERTQAGGVVVESGVLLGRSLAYLAAECESRESKAQLIGYDLWCIDEKEAGPTRWAQIQQAVEPYGSQEAAARANLAGYKVDVFTEDGLVAPSWHKDSSVSVVFLDDCHETKHVATEIVRWWPKLAPGGLLAGHDFDSRSVYDGVADGIRAIGGPAIEVVWPRTWLMEKPS